MVQWDSVQRPAVDRSYAKENAASRLGLKEKNYYKVSNWQLDKLRKRHVVEDIRKWHVERIRGNVKYWEVLTLLALSIDIVEKLHFSTTSSCLQKF